LTAHLAVSADFEVRAGGQEASSPIVPLFFWWLLPYSLDELMAELQNPFKT